MFALSPLAVFLCLYLATSLIVGDFYKVPITVAFLLSSVYAVAVSRAGSLQERLRVFGSGAAEPGIMLMIWIFILAGAFAESARAIGAVDATVGLTLHLLPGNLLLAGIFIASCVVSLSVGTSVGTIVALTPVAMGVAGAAGVDPAMMLGLVVGGAFFGDNLSFISDTTIAATRTQGCRMSDKFRVNFRIVAPVALALTAYYVFAGFSLRSAVAAPAVDWLRALPYALVLATAVCGLDVMIVLTLGIAATGIVGMATGTMGVFDWFGAMGKGIAGMSDLIIVTLMVGGMLAMIKQGGGMDYVVRKLTRHVRGPRGAELCIAALVAIANLCTANNTIAILSVGGLSADIARRFKVDPRRAASLLDTFSCVVQGMLPYGAQLLMAAGLAGISPLAIIRYLYYPAALGIFALISIAWGTKLHVVARR